MQLKTLVTFVPLSRQTIHAFAIAKMLLLAQATFLESKPQSRYGKCQVAPSPCLQSQHRATADSDAASEAQLTALHFAAEEGHADIAALLLDCGANIEARTKHRETALCLAAQNGHVAMNGHAPTVK